MPAERFLFFPLNRRGGGSGHMRRCRQVAGELASRGMDVRLLLEKGHLPNPEFRSLEEWMEILPDFDSEIKLSVGISGEDVQETGEPENPGFRSSLVLFDRRSTDIDELKSWIPMSTPVLLDDDGDARSCAPLVIDTIPGPRTTESNISSVSLLSLPPRTRIPDVQGDILLSFGGDDSEGLTVRTLMALTAAGIAPSRISLTLPVGGNAENLPEAVTVLTAPTDLKNRLSGFGCVFCSYGLTAWESLAAGCAVITVDPGPYHAFLSREAGFPGIGTAAVGTNNDSPETVPPELLMKLKELLEHPSELESQTDALAMKWLEEDAAENDLADLLSSLEAPEAQCAACTLELPPVIARFPRRSYYRCPRCLIVGLYRFQMKADEYGPAYFQQEYEAQYGRSYLEDFQSIKDMGVSRLKQISSKAIPGGTLLDIGCAFGPFLSAAAEAGYRPHGSDVSVEGTTYVREVLGFPAVNGRFPTESPAEALGMDGFDVVSLWYVIEHFADLATVLHRLNSLVNDRGVLALSTPNGSGISARLSLGRFLKRSPGDHYTIWTPRSARRLLARHGFRVYRIRITGHHPERFPGHPPPGGLLHGIYRFVSRLTGLGDTFEVYAVKEKPFG